MLSKLEGTFIVYDKQGALAAHIKNHFRRTKLKIYHLKDPEHLPLLMDSPEVENILFVVFIFAYESDLLDALAFTEQNIPVVYAPTNKITYQKLKKIKGVEVMNIVQSKYNYSTEIVKLLFIYGELFHN